jgi:hypothetical protein
MDAGGVFAPCKVHLIDIVGSVALEEGVAGILEARTRKSGEISRDWHQGLREGKYSYHARALGGRRIMSLPIRQPVDKGKRSSGSQAEF